MDDLLQETENLNQLLCEHKGQDVSVLDLREINNWTDFFIIATATSKTHMDGLERHIAEFCRGKEIEIYGRSGFKKSGKNTAQDWRIIDLGSIIIHLMTADARNFYELERLWHPVKRDN
jgi:ribosome-associated protein